MVIVILETRRRADDNETCRANVGIELPVGEGAIEGIPTTLENQEYL